MMLDDSRLRVFLKVAERCSFTRAAEDLGITQPAVSQSIAELERQTGAVLFERSRSRVALTEQGRVFQVFAERILREYERLDAVFTHYEDYRDLLSHVAEIRSNPLSEFAEALLK
ncbi:MAG: LysR family transcriptional regulator [Bacteroidales bacterium]|jgi:DNA-binding transcriptional LysR family regulator|nr:LysR family transcriptional regulator [Bacillota bacterium]MCR5571224.1 LysR family transcriptional regulator [Bacteroidales bacterium]